MPSQPWTSDRIRTLLASNPLAVERALMVLYREQTADEQQARHTRECNSRGFNAADAPTLSRLAELVRAGHTLHPGQIAVARRRLSKYAGQLLDAIPEPIRNPQPKQLELEDF